MFIEILFNILLFKGGVLIYAGHCMSHITLDVIFLRSISMEDFEGSQAQKV